MYPDRYPELMDITELFEIMEITSTRTKGSIKLETDTFRVIRIVNNGTNEDL